MSEATRSTDHAAEARKLLEVAAREVSLDMAAAAQGAAQTHALLAIAGEIREVLWTLRAALFGAVALGTLAAVLVLDTLGSR
ncbi:MAG TPA: hypothetical protein VFM87_08685 [Agrococcus sp.]|nr:hypothetical protein [Agrococcus sp.]